ncbi:tryptophan--tRNA ligase [Salinivibrio sp. ES.052]|uniref:tryptophan--tRNA ligase n=2 Tax=unclassified Salinivibrio TaxID=2636825 RepID=UPI0009280B57|nr:tryptophan--tRNA ligase [Salinivibrio sp. ES.052]SIO34277.1 tryptophanyl-tRNA synthetase [Salinivibrio sp. ES.052]
MHTPYSIDKNAIDKNDVILTGDRATGRLHLGHYSGSLSQRLALQGQCAQTILVADMQGLTDNGHQPGHVATHILGLVADYLAVGLDPDKVTICQQSQLPALAELTMFYSNLVSYARLVRNPTVKHEINDKQFGQQVPVGFLTYPISQAADITAFGANLVPVGDDQLPMIEQTNDIVRKFNHVVGEPVLRECRALTSKASRLPGVDGKSKMSKSLGNAIYLSDDNDTIRDAVRSMYTDPQHLRVSDPGRVEGNVVFTYLDTFHPDAQHIAELKAHYQRGGLGDMTVKNVLTDSLISLISPIRERRKALMNAPDYLSNVLKDGQKKARIQTDQTCQSIKRALGLLVG